MTLNNAASDSPKNSLVVQSLLSFECYARQYYCDFCKRSDTANVMILQALQGDTAVLVISVVAYLLMESVALYEIHWAF